MLVTRPTNRKVNHDLSPEARLAQIAALLALAWARLTAQQKPIAEKPPIPANSGSEGP